MFGSGWMDCAEPENVFIGERLGYDDRQDVPGLGIDGVATDRGREGDSPGKKGERLGEIDDVTAGPVPRVVVILKHEIDRASIGEVVDLERDRNAGYR